MILPPLDLAIYVTLRNLNLYDAPMLGAKYLGIIPGGTRVTVVKWKQIDDYLIYASIGGHPEQWLRAYHNNDKNIEYVGGDE